MKGFQSLLGFPGGGDTAPEKQVAQKSQKNKTSGTTGQRGCDFCPLNKIPGLNKVKNLDLITGRRIMAWAQNPGEHENRKKMELVGPAGRLFWEIAREVGLTRDMCDVQNVVRCWTVDTNELDQFEPRNPSKEEIRCCSIYNEEAIQRNNGKAKVHLVLGQVAAKALLRGEYRKNEKTFFSKKLNAWVICTYHPSYFLRGAPKSKLREFRGALAAAMDKVKEKSGRFSYIERQDYKSVPASRLKEEIDDPIREAAKNGIVVVVDIEDGTNAKGENVIVYVGFCWGKGKSRGVFFEHEKLKADPDADQAKFHTVADILTDPTILKALQHGVYDEDKLRKLWGLKLAGFVHDTQYSEYQRFSNRYSYGLQAIADMRFREFAGYKGILDPYKEKDTDQVNFWKLPPKIIVTYNGADCDLTKRIQVSNDGKINQALHHVLIRCAPVLMRMEEQYGPWLDFKHADVLDKWLPIRIKALTDQLRKIAKNARFNPNKPQDVAVVVYDQLKLGRHLDEEMRREFPRSTREEIMLLLSNFHEFPQMELDVRKLSKKKSTYLDGYRRSALAHEGRVRTKWWLTGTVTNRLRSGGERGNKKDKTIVNLQNVHGAPEIECLLVSDVRWRDLYRAWVDENRKM